jgi:hypothetical protein
VFWKKAGPIAYIVLGVILGLTSFYLAGVSLGTFKGFSFMDFLTASTGQRNLIAGAYIFMGLVSIFGFPILGRYLYISENPKVPPSR